MKIRVQKKQAKKHIKYSFSKYDFLVKRFDKDLYNNFKHDLNLLLFDISNKDIEFLKLQKEYYDELKVKRRLAAEAKLKEKKENELR